MATDELLPGSEGLFLDMTGGAHLFGGEAALLAEIERRLEAARIPARAAVADSPGAAWALARFGGLAIAPPGGAREALADLPAEALRLDETALKLLRRFGVERIGGLYGLPRAGLARRFPGEAGLNLVRRLDQALGVEPEPLAPVRPVPLYRAWRLFPEPLTDIEGVAHSLPALAEALCAQLDRDGKGARRLVLTGFRTDGRTTAIEAGLSAAGARPAHLLRLLKERGLERLDLGFGVDALMLAACKAEDARTRQTDLDETPAQANAAALSALVDRIEARLGEGAAARPALRDSHIPERAEAWLSDPPDGVEAGDAGQSRPILILDPPEPVQAIAELPDGLPAHFVWRRAARRVVRAEGPRADLARVVAARRRRLGRPHPRLLPRRGRGRPPLLAVPRWPLQPRGRRSPPRLVDARGVRVSPQTPFPPPSRGRVREGGRRGLREGVARAASSGRPPPPPKTSSGGGCGAMRSTALGFRRQQPIGAYVVDFYCASARLVVELDGPLHDDALVARRDEARTAWLTAQGYRVIRFRNAEVWERIEDVLDAIRRVAGTEPPSPPPPPQGGEGVVIPYAELDCRSNFSFLEGASHPGELVEQARALGHAAMGVADRNTLAGVVRAHAAARDAGLRLLVGCRLVFTDGAALIVYPRDRAAYGRLCRLLSLGKSEVGIVEPSILEGTIEDLPSPWRGEGQGWGVAASQDRARSAPDLDLSGSVSTPIPSPFKKGETRLTFGQAAALGEGLIALAPAPEAIDDAFEARLAAWRAAWPDDLYLAAAAPAPGRRPGAAEPAGGDRGADRRADGGDQRGAAPPLRAAPAAGRADLRARGRDHRPGWRPAAGQRRALSEAAPRRMARLFAGHEDALARTLKIAEACRFSLDELSYRYPDEPIPPGRTAPEHLRHLVRKGARELWPDGVPSSVVKTLWKELKPDPQGRLRALLPDRARHRPLGAQPGHPVPGARVGGQFHRLLLPEDHLGGPDPAGRAVRAVHLRGALRAARHRRRLRARATRGGDPVRLPPLRPPPRRHLRHGDPLPPALGDPRRRQGAGAHRGRHRHAGLHRSGARGAARSPTATSTAPA